MVVGQCDDINSRGDKLVQCLRRRPEDELLVDGRGGPTSPGSPITVSRLTNIRSGADNSSATPAIGSLAAIEPDHLHVAGETKRDRVG